MLKSHQAVIAKPGTIGMKLRLYAKIWIKNTINRHKRLHSVKSARLPRKQIMSKRKLPKTVGKRN